MEVRVRDRAGNLIRRLRRSHDAGTVATTETIVDEDAAPPRDGPVRFIATESSHTIRTGFQRFERPVYDYRYKESPCRAQCPTGHNVALALYLARTGRLDLADECFRQDNPFPSITGRVCYHPCEGACNRADYDEAVAINAIERAASVHGPGEDVPKASMRYEETVGVVGAGPAGLSCAYHLTCLGYEVTVYEANEKPGGVLTYGIPTYRLPRSVVEEEIARLEQLGVKIRLGVYVGRDIAFEDLRQTHSALFVAAGLRKSRLPDVPLPQDERLMAGTDFLSRVSSGDSAALHGAVAVLGGGDVAVDVARTALRSGAATVTLCCLESADQMPAHPEEVEAADEEGIEIFNDVAATSVKELEGGFEVVLNRVESFRRRGYGVSYTVSKQPVATIHVDYLFFAIGQEADLSFLPEPYCRHKRLEVDAFGATGMPGVFAGGDIVGTYSVVRALGGGKQAAIGIDAYLRELPLHRLYEGIKVGDDGAMSMEAYMELREGHAATRRAGLVPLGEINVDYFPRRQRVEINRLLPDRRTAGFEEVNLPLSTEAAATEAERCFNCGLCTMCGNCFVFCPDSSVLQRDGWGFEIDLDHCKGCGVCVQECPHSAMSIVAEAEVNHAAAEGQSD